MTILVLVLGYWAASILALTMVCRLPVSGTAVHRYLVVGGLIGLAMLLHAYFIFGLTIAWWISALFYAFVCELYIFAFTLVGSSISAGLLLRLRQNPLTVEEIEAAYSPASMVESRLHKMEATGLLERQENGEMRMTERGASLQRAFAMLRRFFRHEAAS
ncbi:MAG: hypothetical protein RIE31_11265 [Alphaproteobacteria bacterium]